MRNTGLEEAQAGIKTAGRNINNLRYADDTTLMAESEEELKSLLMKGKEESEKFGLKLNIQKMRIMASGPIISWEIDGETVETGSDFILGGSRITADGDPSSHDGVITHLEPDILECEVKWALGSITMNKASGGDGIPVELFHILKDDAMKVLHSICQQICKTQQ